MANLTNPLSASSQYYIGKANTALKTTGKQLSSGLKGPSGGIVDYVVGSSLQTSAAVLNGVLKGVSYGGNLCTVGQASLGSAKDIITELRSLVAVAGNATGAVLAELNALYKEQIININRILSTAEFDGRILFNGSLSNTTGVPAGALMPAGGAPLAIRLGESMTNTTLIQTQRLLSGNGQAPDVAVGDFNPIIPTTAESVTDKTAAVAQLLASIALAVDANTDTVTNMDAAIRGLAVPALAADPVGNAVVTALHSVLGDDAAATILKFGLDDIAGANACYNAALTAAITAAEPYINSDAASAINSIFRAEVGIANATTNAQYAVMIKAIPLPGNAVGDAIIKAAQDTVSTPAWIAANAAIFRVDATGKPLVFVAAITQANIGASASAYSLTPDTVHNRTQAQQLALVNTLLTKAAAIVTGEISALGGKMEELSTAGDDLGMLISVDEDLAQDYLATNYEKAASDFKELLLRIQGALAEITQGFQVPQAVLQLINA